MRDTLIQELILGLETLAGESWADSSYLLAVSGGRDSMVLLDALGNLLPTERLTVAHFNHALRGAKSDAEENRVREICRTRGIAFFSSRGAGRDPSEAALRDERHAFLRQIRERTSSRWIVTAHHLDDQIENHFMSLLRGTGLIGLSGMTPRRDDYLKPLLSISREAIDRYASVQGVAFFDDGSNASGEYFRNRVRRDLIPRLADLASEFGGRESAWRRISRTFEEARWAKDFIEGELVQRYVSMAVVTPLWVRLDLKGWLGVERRWREGVLRRALLDLGVRDSDRLAIERVSTSIEQGARGAELAGRIRLTVSCGWLFVSRQEPLPPLTIERAGNRVWCSAIGWEAIVDADATGEDTQWRFFSRGDRVGSHKLKRLWLEQRVPEPERRLIPLLARARSSEILWIYPQTSSMVHSIKASFPFSFL